MMVVVEKKKKKKKKVDIEVTGERRQVQSSRKRRTYVHTYSKKLSRSNGHQWPKAQWPLPSRAGLNACQAQKTHFDSRLKTS